MTVTMSPSTVSQVSASGFYIGDKDPVIPAAVFCYFQSPEAATSFTQSFVSEVLGGENEAMKAALIESMGTYLSEMDMAAREEQE